MFTFSDQDITIEQLIAVRQKLCQQPDLLEVINGYQTITVYFDRQNIHYDHIQTWIEEMILNDKLPMAIGKLHHIPVCYEPDYAIDLQDLMTYHHLTAKEIIDLHTAPTYQIAFLGFSPGFPFLTGLDPKLYTPRKERPRTTVPKGAVGIAGHQTGIYPASSPGGWQIIGQTPIDLLTIDNPEQPTLLLPGDQLVFYPISKEEFQNFNQKGAFSS